MSANTIPATPAAAPNPRKLRTILVQNPQCAQLFDQAERLAKGLLDPEKPPQPKSCIPFFTEHGRAHCEQVERNLDEILFGPDGYDYLNDHDAFYPSPEEAMYLLSAAWLHDIGMIAGIFSKDHVGQDTDWDEIRKEHEFRTSDYLHDCWNDCGNWTPSHKLSLATICIYHRRQHPLRDMQPARADGASGGQVRLRELAALLRLADACHVDVTRAPSGLRNLYIAIGMPPDSLLHWGAPGLIQRVVFDHRRKTIKLHCQAPPVANFGAVTVDFGTVIRHLKDDLIEELDGIIPFLVRYSNTAFKSIKTEILRPLALRDPGTQMREMWPYLLSSAHSASEVACMVAALVVAMLGNKRHIPKEEFEQFLEHALAIHPFNLLLRALIDDLRKMANADTAPSAVCDAMNQYLGGRQTACNRVAEKTAQLLNIGAEDWLVVHGYSHTVMALLRRHLLGHRGKLLIVECRRWCPGQNHAIDDARRFCKELQALGFDCTRITLESLVGVFAQLAKDHRTAKVLLGARGVYSNGKVLGMAGSGLIALAAKRYGIKVHILADQAKRRDLGEVSDIEHQLRRLVSAVTANSNGVAKKVRPQIIDLLDESMYDSIVDGREEPITESASAVTPASPLARSDQSALSPTPPAGGNLKSPDDTGNSATPAVSQPPSRPLGAAGI